MAHRIEDISGIISAGIMVYRRMQETVQTQYGMLHPPSPEEEDLVPLHKYYGENGRPMIDRGLNTILKVHLYYSESESDVAPDGFIESAIECLH